MSFQHAITDRHFVRAMRERCEAIVSLNDQIKEVKALEKAKDAEIRQAKAELFNLESQRMELENALAILEDES